MNEPSAKASLAILQEAIEGMIASEHELAESTLAFLRENLEVLKEYDTRLTMLAEIAEVAQHYAETEPDPAGLPDDRRGAREELLDKIRAWRSHNTACWDERLAAERDRDAT